MLLQVIATGRKWGQKLDPSEKSLSINGVRCVVKEFDAWEGGDGKQEKQQFFRCTSIELATPIRDDRW